MKKDRVYACRCCIWSNGDGDEPTDHCENGAADQYDQFPHATGQCSGFEKSEPDPTWVNGWPFCNYACKCYLQLEDVMNERHEPGVCAVTGLRLEADNFSGIVSVCIPSLSVDHLRWRRGRPEKAGLYLIRGDSGPGAKVILGVIRIHFGPRGGQKSPHWVGDPKGSKAQPSPDWEWLILEEFE